jgi:tetratricopeptide (TPR) repeat protein
VPSPSPANILPPSTPFPVATPKSTPAPIPQPEVDPAAAQFLSKGIAQHSAGNFEGAIASYTSAIRLAPKLAVLYLNRANAYLNKGDFNAAMADATKALELKVEKADDAYVIRGAARAGLGDYDAAIADCNRALQINPKHALAYNNRANDKIRKRDYSGALADCNKSIALDPNSALPYYNRGYVYFNSANPAGALADWKKAVRMQPSFGAELNPRIAQLEAQTKTTPKSGRGSSDASGWTDLTNARQKIVGAWQGPRHMVQYLADGSFYTDPHLVPNPPRGQWRIEGDRLIQIHPPSNITTTDNILSLTDKELVLRNRQGETFRLTRIAQ